MDELRKKNLKSIVAQRLVLFSALESGRPRSENGSPLASSGGQFIYNRGLSEEVVSDFQKINKLKSPNRLERIDSLIARQRIFESISPVSMDASHKSPNLNGTNGVPVYSRDVNSEPMSPGGTSTGAFSVRQLRKLFEGSTVPLTARNSLEAERLRPESDQKVETMCEAGRISPGDNSETRKPVKEFVGKIDTTSESCKPSPPSKKKPVPLPQDFKGLSPESSRRAQTLPAFKGPIEGPAFGSKTLPLQGNEKRTESEKSDPPAPEMQEQGRVGGLTNENNRENSGFARPIKPPPRIPSTDGNGNALIKNHDNEADSKGGLANATSYRRDISVTGSVYVEPSCKIENGVKRDEKPPELPRKAPIKQRSLGRGEIKPYEIVTIVADEKKETGSENRGKKTSLSQRMESMYIETFGDVPEPCKSTQKDGGYEEISEYDELGDQSLGELDSNEFDLSNLNAKEDRMVSITALAELERRCSGPIQKPGSKGAMQRQFSDVSDEYASIDESDAKSQSSTLRSDFGDLSLDRSCSSVHSDIIEGWESDEFDEYTDDEMLDETKHKGKASDGDTSKKKIWNIVNEILATEKAYAKRLNLLDKVFQARLLKEAKENAVVPEKVVQEIFSNLSSICTFHSTILLPDLEKRISNWSSNEKIGDIFKTLGHCLKLYTDYVTNFEHATTTLNQWTKKSPKFASVIEELQKLPECEHLTLQHHMLEPIQRVPRYKLLLQDYLKKLPKDSPDRSEAEESLVVISKAASHSNDSMKGMDKFKKLVEIEERIVEGLRGESLATASRIFIKEGELVKIAARSDQKQARILLLFNDLVLCCNKIAATGKLKVRQMMEIPGMSVQDGDEVDLGDVNTFRIRSRQRVLDLAASSHEEKLEWIETISEVIKEYEAKRGSLLKQHIEEEAQRESLKGEGTLKVGESAPVWVKDEDVSMCMLCAVRFSLLSRRHHCRACGRIVCDNCSKFRAQLAYMNNTVKRVCYVCNTKLNAGKLQETESFKLKSLTLAQVNRDPKRRRSTIVSEIKGDLTWKSPGRGWMKGYFTIADMVLYVQKGKKDPKAQMTIALPGYGVTRPGPDDEIDESKHPFTFKLHFGNKKEMTYYFQAETEETMQRWIDVITYSIKAEKPPANYKTL